jgi:ribonuclease HI
VYALIARAQDWLRENTYANEVRKWKTDTWGESPADFGRK